MSDVEKLYVFLKTFGLTDPDMRLIDAFDDFCMDIGATHNSKSHFMEPSRMWCLERILTTPLTDEAYHYIIQYFKAKRGQWIEKYSPPREDDGLYGPIVETTKNQKPRDGYVYVAACNSVPGKVKIGHTRKSVEKRMKSLSSRTIVPDPYICIWSRKFKDCMEAEKMAHELLCEHRVNDSEFFQLSREEAKNSLENLFAKQD